MAGLEGLLAGRTLVKRYRIEDVIGRGGFAVVYRAQDERLGRTVAVKVITVPAPDPQTRAQLHERFNREARAAASLQHPNVVTVHDFGTDPELEIDFLVMELLRGEDLASRLARAGRPGQEEALRILRAAGEGLAAGHRVGMVHRDVKPGNVFLAERDDGEGFRVVVLDFGIVQAATGEETATRLTQDGSNPLSPAYASPEQLRGESQLSPASDVFSLGVVGFQLLTGEKPFGVGGADRSADWDAAGAMHARNPQIAPEVVAVIARALAPEPEQRFPDASAFVDALDAAMQQEDRTMLFPAAAPVPPRSAPRPAAPAPVANPEPRRGFPVWAIALLLVLVAGVVAVFALGGGEDSPEPVVGAPDTVVVVQPDAQLDPQGSTTIEPEVVDAAPAPPTVATPLPAPEPVPNEPGPVPPVRPQPPPQPQPQPEPEPPLDSLPPLPLPRDTVPADTVLPDTVLPLPPGPTPLPPPAPFPPASGSVEQSDLPGGIGAAKGIYRQVQRLPVQAEAAAGGMKQGANAVRVRAFASHPVAEAGIVQLATTHLPDSPEDPVPVARAVALQPVFPEGRHSQG